MRILLVDDEPQVLRGITRMIRAEQDDWDIRTATSGTEALELLDVSAFNVIVSDMSMPVMDGAELLDIVERRSPATMRIILSGQADRESILRAVKPVHQYLAKPCDPNILISTIRGIESYQSAITSPEVLEAAGNYHDFWTPPSIREAIEKELAAEPSSTKSLANAISHDPILTGKVLQLANSSIFGPKTPIVSMEQSLSLIGVDMLQTMVTPIPAPSQTPAFDTAATAEIFEHGISVAKTARQIAESESDDQKLIDTVFSAALLQDIGKIILSHSFPKRYQSILDQAASDGTPSCEAEQLEFGASHPQLGAYLLELWGLPKELSETVANHHDAECCQEAGQVSQIVFAARFITEQKTNSQANPETSQLPTKLDQLIGRWKSRPTEEAKHAVHETQNSTPAFHA
ncbi:HDOD domain-containing protein [Stieleria sp. JC731]|uniref:response regulator n=1 Tax=Pirellulaceae TaxID=2691357 RepID=UPI001E300034|nr:response regulator [Stieleria sp. JC731]MCC9601698.1 HDOD domain-containing protein [Stieleria sp. JC731]